MSMLTPPGMGGKYRITGDKYPRMRRGRPRGRIVLAAVASLAVIGLIGWGSLQLFHVFTGGDKARAAGPAPCAKRASASPAAARTTSGKLPAPAQIKVNVLNATPRGGLAKKTADELKKRGFTIGDVGNASKAYDKKVKGVGILLGAKTAAQAALPVLGTQLADAERKTDGRAAPAEVDLIIGTKFTALTAKPSADKALATLSRPKPSPSATPACT
ncbi:LytR C-terminal domain-containing protein [Streptomyces sp. NPDC049813]|uniref:LytR C-terminal domain-containing protein n=1 Tax=Streptomyces sp. NPDC049813 TaxID=3365597 RepID=UPI0037BC94C2